jgi:Mn2+/Fe2+ NRAMP family transporter
MTFGVALLIIGGFLLGGAYSIYKADSDTAGRTAPQLVFAVVLLVAALIATVAGVLYLV